jgi:dTDP-4-dehydrorhamnose 3,5-epimerase
VTLAVRTFPIAGPLLVAPKRFSDGRGFFCETYHREAYAAAGITALFVQDNQSLSEQRGTVRGLHFQAPPHAQAKLVRVGRGRILDVFVDIRNGSATYGQHGAAELGAEDGLSLFIPEGFAHGFCTLEPFTEVLYKTSALYAPQSEGGLRWDDTALAIAWPDFAGAALSEKDRRWPALSELDSPFAHG